MAKEVTKQKEGQMMKPEGLPSPFEEMERWMDEFLPRRWMRQWGWPAASELGRAMGRFGPRVDLIDREDELLLRAEIPGAKKEDLQISITENAVAIAGSSQREEKEEGGDYYRREIARGEFSRTISLPVSVDTDKAVAHFEDGVLELKMPKVSKAKRRQIKLD